MATKVKVKKRLINLKHKWITHQDKAMFIYDEPLHEIIQRNIKKDVAANCIDFYRDLVLFVFN